MVDWGERVSWEFQTERARERESKNEERRPGLEGIDWAKMREVGKGKRERETALFRRLLLISSFSRTLERSSSVSEALELLSEDMARSGFSCFISGSNLSFLFLLAAESTVFSFGLAELRK